MHLNQFYQAEYKLLGTLDDTTAMAERYVATLASAMIERHAGASRYITCSTSHITHILALAKFHNNRFPRITLAEALSVSHIVSSPTLGNMPSQPTTPRVNLNSHLQEIRRFGGIVWLTELDHLSGAFYQAFVFDTDKAKALCADIFLAPGEVLGLGQRHVNAEEVSQALKLQEVLEKNYRRYMDIWDEGSGGKCLQRAGRGIIKQDDIWL